MLSTPQLLNPIFSSTTLNHPHPAMHGLVVWCVNCISPKRAAHLLSIHESTLSMHSSIQLPTIHCPEYPTNHPSTHPSFHLIYAHWTLLLGTIRFPKCAPWASSITWELIEMHILGLTPDLQNLKTEQQSGFQQVVQVRGGMLKFEDHGSRHYLIFVSFTLSSCKSFSVHPTCLPVFLRTAILGEIQFTHHTINPRKVYSSTVFSIFTELCYDHCD